MVHQVGLHTGVNSRGQGVQQVQIVDLPYVDLRQYGHIGAGGDDTQALADAIDDLPANGGKLVAPANTTIRVSDSLGLPNYTEFVGSGRGSIIHWIGAAGGHVFDLSDTNSGRIANLHISGDTADAGARVGRGVLLDNTFSWRLDNVQMRYLERGYTFQDNAGDNYLTNPIVRFADVGFLVDSLVNNVHGGTIWNCPTGVTTTPTTGFGGMHFVGTTFNGAESDRHIDLQSSGRLYSFNGCWFESASISNARLGDGSVGPAGVQFIGGLMSSLGDVNLELNGGASETLLIGTRLETACQIDVAAGHLNPIFINVKSSPDPLVINDLSGTATIIGDGYTPEYRKFVGTYDPIMGHITQAFPTANAARLYAVSVSRPTAVDTLYVRVITASGNIDLGIYNDSGTRVASSGSIACPTAAQTVGVDMTAAVTLLPGQRYWFALAADNTTVSFSGAASASAAPSVPGRITAGQVAASFPLPATLTLPTAQVSTAIGIFA